MDEFDFEEALQPEKWSEEQILHTPTFQALLEADGTLYIRGAALREGFSPEATQALARFLAAHVTVPPLEPVDDFSDFSPHRIDGGEDTE